jgi:hypothetical protein
VGIAIRRLREATPVVLFLILWGGLFGGIPLLIGWEIFLEEGLPILCIAQGAVFLGAILGAAFLPSVLVESLVSANTAIMGFGGIFLLVGVGVAAAMFRENLLLALIIGLVFGVVGVGAVLLGFWNVLRGKDQ